MQTIIKQPHTVNSQQLASPIKGSAIRTRELVQNAEVKMVLGVSFSKLPSVTNKN